MSLFGKSNVELTERITALEGKVATLELSQLEMQDKVFKWMHRSLARTRRSVEDETVAPVAAAHGQNTDPVSAKLLALRSRAHVPSPSQPPRGQLGFDGEEVK
jgi:hypothetical protein